MGVNIIADLWNALLNFWNSLATEAKITLVIGIVSLVITIVIGILSLRQKVTLFLPRADEYRLVSFKDLAIESELLSATLGKIEPYVERETFKKQLDANLIPQPVKLLIHGLPGIGKTREAIEIVRKLNERNPRNIYLRQGSVTIPSPTWTPKKRRNLVLFVDDLKADSEIYQTEIKDARYQEPLSQRLRKTLDYFGALDTNVDIILTMKTEEYDKLDAAMSDVLGQYGIKEIELEELSLVERKSYLKNLADFFRFKPCEDEFLDSLSEMTIEIGKFYEFLRSLHNKRIDNEDIKRFKQEIKQDIQSKVSELPDNENFVIQILSKLKQFSIEPYHYIIIEMFAFSERGFKWRRRRKCRKAISNLDGKWFRVKGRRIYCHESKLLSKDERDPDIKDDLHSMSQIFELIVKAKKIRKKDIYSQLTPLAEVLHKHGMYEDSNGFNDRILDLSDEVLPREVRSQVVFFKGYNYYLLGRKYWNEAESFYKESIDLNEKNFFAKHALATLCQRVGRSVEALKILNEITAENKKDLLVYKTKLEIFIDTDIDSEKGGETCKKMEGLLKTVSFSPKITLSAKLSIARFSIKKGELLRKEGKLDEARKHFNEIVIPQFESLINEIPPKEQELMAIVRNVYGCFLYNTLGRKEYGELQLEKAIDSWPEHLQSLHKLLTISMERDDKSYYWEMAEKYIAMILDINECHYPTLLSRAILRGKLKNWGDLPESMFWEKVSDVYEMYREALEPESDNYPSDHNPRVHHTTGVFLWLVENQADKKGFLQNKPSRIPSASDEFEESVQVKEHFKEEEVPFKIRIQLLITYYTFGAYLLAISGGKPEIADRGESFKKMGDDLSRKLNYPIEMWRVHWTIGRFKEMEEEHQDAFSYFKTSAEGQKSPKLYGVLRSIVNQWIKQGKIDLNTGRRWKFECSKRAYELDHEGNLDLRNVSDYAHELYGVGKKTASITMLKEAKRLFRLLFNKYREIGNDKEASYNLMFEENCKKEIEKARI